MNVYFTKEFSEDLKFHQYPINGFKCRLVRYNTNYSPATDGISQSTVFRGYSSISDGFGWNSEDGLRIMYDLVDDPLAKSADTQEERHYQGLLFMYYRLIDGINYPMIAFLIHDPEDQLCKGINGLTLVGVRDVCLLDWTDKGDGHESPGDRSTYNTWLRDNSKLYGIYKVLHDYTEASDNLASELNYYQSIVEKYNINGLIK